MTGKLLASLAISVFALATQAAGLDTAALLSHYRHLHQNPELSLQEVKTAAYLVSQLRGMGFDVTTDVGGHGFVALLKNGDGPQLMYRADMDGLPIPENTGLPYSSTATGVIPSGEVVPVMHGCGHDVHMTVLLGVASRLAAQRQQWQGTLMLVGQPAEEIGAGAKAMLADKLFQRFGVPAANIALHVSASLPAGQVGYVSGYGMANVDSVDVDVYGQGGHGAYPQATKDPVVMAAEIVLGLQTIVSRELSPLDSAVVTVGSIHGGTKHNIISDEVNLQLTVRSYSDETRAFLLRRIQEIAHGVARTAGMPEDRLPSVTIKDEYTPAVYNSPALLDQLVPLLQAELGPDAVVEISPVMGGEDFSRYGRTREKIPSTLLWLGTVSADNYRASQAGKLDLPSLHSAKFAPDAEPAIVTGVDAVTAILMGLFLAE